MNLTEFNDIYQENLSTKQRQVLNGVLRGLSNREIARTIDVTTGNISHHIKNSARKFGIKQNSPRDYLIELYKKILINPHSRIISNNSQEERELILSGLIVRENQFIKITNPIYRQVFNLDLFSTTNY